MNPTIDHIDCFILRTVREELSPFELILSKAQQELEPKDVISLPPHLLKLVSLRLVNAYLLHAETPFVTPVETDAEGIYRHWFFISGEGLKLLIGEQKQPDPEPVPPPGPMQIHRPRRRTLRPQKGFNS